ncbi:MAG: HAMP domain-containing histidine kinase [Thermomicrobiales bacterium]|nr:HAMP domain-containing histidine kinase [Thermomicrobiales bacterium]
MTRLRPQTPPRWTPHHGAPPWWPDGEPWPPRRKRDRKRSFLQRVGCFFGLVVGLLIVSSMLGWVFGGGGQGHSFGLPGLLIVLGVLFLVGRSLRRTAAPIGDVMAAAERVAEGDYTARVHTPAEGDVGRLVSAFNSMTERLQANEEQRRGLFADVAHELRTPLAVIRGNVEGMLDGVYPRDDERLQTLLDETAVLTRLLDDLRTLSLADMGTLALHREPVEVDAFVADVVAAFQPRARAVEVSLCSDIAPLPALDLDPVRIRQTLENLLANALRHTPRGGRVRLDVRPDGDRVRFAVSDTGSGIPPEHLTHVFDRFWKSADSGGSGLGLAIARGLVVAHGGTIGAENLPGGGACVWFTLPAWRSVPVR